MAPNGTTLTKLTGQLIQLEPGISQTHIPPTESSSSWTLPNVLSLRLTNGSSLTEYQKAQIETLRPTDLGFMTNFDLASEPYFPRKH